MSKEKDNRFCVVDHANKHGDRLRAKPRRNRRRGDQCRPDTAPTTVPDDSELLAKED